MVSDQLETKVTTGKLDLSCWTWACGGERPFFTDLPGGVPCGLRGRARRTAEASMAVAWPLVSACCLWGD